MIPLLAASEKGTGQTESPDENSAEMWWKLRLSRRGEVVWNDSRYRVIVSYP